VRRSPGETVTLRTRLVQRDGFWRLLGLHEGVVRGQR
jgi:hypothetical protein